MPAQVYPTQPAPRARTSAAQRRRGCLASLILAENLHGARAITPSPPGTPGGEGRGEGGTDSLQWAASTCKLDAPPHPNPLPRSTGGEGTRRMLLGCERCPPNGLALARPHESSSQTIMRPV